MRFLLLVLLQASVLSAEPLELWFRQPAASKKEAVKVGNEQVGALIFGDPKSERIETQSYTLLLDWLDGDQPFSDYRRSLNLRDGLAVASWKRGSSEITETVLASRPDGVLLIHLRSDMPGALNFRVRFEDQTARASGVRGELIQKRLRKDEPGYGHEVRARVLPFESEVAPEGTAMVVHGEGEALIVVAAATVVPGDDHKAYFANLLNRLGKKYADREEDPDFTKIWHGALEAHLTGHRKMMDGCTIDLGGHEAEKKPTDERLRAIGLDWTDPTLLLPNPPMSVTMRNDPSLAVLMYHYTGYCNSTSDEIGFPRTDLPGLLARRDQDVITLLPKLPEEWKDGMVSGLPIGNDFCADLAWKDGKLTSYKILRAQGLAPAKVKVRAQGKEGEIWTK